MTNGAIGMWKSTIFYYVSIIVFCVLGVYLAKKKDDGYISFKDAFLLCVVIITIGMFLSQIFYAGYLQTLTDAEKDMMTDIIVENQLETFNYIEEDELEFEDRLRDQMEKMFEVTPLIIVTTVASAFFMYIVGLIISMIMRKERT
jgi:ABC-type antimicrobial peptide transport system permease subunit